MKAEVIDLGPCRKRLKVEVELEKVRKEYEDVCGELGRSLQLPGFRKGRVPRPLLVSRFGKQIDADVKAKLLESSFKDAVSEKKLEPVGQPDVDTAKIEFSVEQPLCYECEVEVKPEFEAPACEGLKLERPSDEVSDAEVDATIDRLRRRLAEFHPVAEPAVADDFVVADIHLTIDGKEAWKDNEMPLGLMEEHVLGLPFALPSARLIGLAAGQRIGEEVELPMNFSVEEYRGKKAHTDIEVKEVKRPRLPEINDDFAKKVGAESAESLRNRVRERLAGEKKAEIEAELRRQVLDQLIAATGFDLPEKLLQRTAENDELRRRHQMKRMGLRDDALSGKDGEELRNVSRQQAERDLRGFLIVEKIAKARGLEATEAEVDEYFVALAARRGLDSAALRARAEEQGEVEMVRSELRERKVMELIMAKAEIVTKTSAQGG
jgi:trigger factor